MDLKPPATANTAEKVVCVLVEAVPDSNINHKVVGKIVVHSDIEKHGRLVVVFKAIREQPEELSVCGHLFRQIRADRDRLGVQHKILVRRVSRLEREVRQGVRGKAGGSIQLNELAETPAVDVIEAEIDLFHRPITGTGGCRESHLKGAFRSPALLFRRTKLQGSAKVFRAVKILGFAELPHLIVPDAELHLLAESKTEHHLRSGVCVIGFTTRGSTKNEYPLSI